MTNQIILELSYLVSMGFFLLPSFNLSEHQYLHLSHRLQYFLHRLDTNFLEQSGLAASHHVAVFLHVTLSRIKSS